MPGPRGQFVCFTCNNYTAEGLAALSAIQIGSQAARVTRETNLTYMCFQQEHGGVENTPHLQGYLQISKVICIDKVTDWLNAIVGTPCHTGKNIGSSESCIDYCTREFGIKKKDDGIRKRDEGTLPVIIGEPVAHGGRKGQGERTDLQEVKDAIEAGMDLVTLRSTFFETFARHDRFLTQYKIDFEQRGHMTALRDSTASVPLRAWQTACLELLTPPPGDRKVRWFWENVGNVGKSWMARYLALHHNALVLGAMKKLDLLHAITKTISGKTVVVFDLTRSTEEGAVKVVYEVLEQLINCVIHSGKYDSQTVWIQQVHLVVFANFEPDRTSMSLDRWDVHHIATPGPSA